MNITAIDKRAATQPRQAPGKQARVRLSALLAIAFLPFSLAAAAPAQQTGNARQAEMLKDSLLIQSGDYVSTRVLNDSDLNQIHVRVTDRGMIPLPLIGEVEVGGMTPGQAGEAISRVYVEKNILVDAHVAVSVEPQVSAQVAVLGYVNGAIGSPSGTSGVSLTLTAPRSLLAVLASAGGFSIQASRTVQILRRGSSVPALSVYLPNDPVQAAQHDVLIYPGDTIMVPRAGIVYVLGDVNRAAGVIMNEDGHLSLLEAISQVGSTIPSAGLKHVMIFRKGLGQYRSLSVNMGRIVKGRDPDVALEPEDAIWVPFSYGKNLLVNGAAIAAAVGSATATGVIYTR